MRRLLGLIVALAFAAQSAGLSQQTALVTRNLRLHSAPKAAATILDSVSEGDVVTILRHGHRTGYYHVITQSQTVGWLSDRYVHLIADPAEVHQPSGVPGSVGSSAATPAVAAGDFDSCPDSGRTQLASIRPLNRLKNRSAAPGGSDIDSSVTLTALLATSHDDTHRFDQGKAAEITGFVYRVIPGGRTETTNCRKSDPVHRDTHIELILTPEDSDETRRVIVEVTPRWRAAMKAQGVDWATATLQRVIEGHNVRIRGWLFIDAQHANAAENTNPGGDKNWRATVWEIHPITSIEVLDH